MEPTNNDFSWVSFLKDNVWTFATGLLGGGSLLSLLQFFRSQKKDNAEATASEVQAQQVASEMWKKELSDYKTFVKQEVTEMRVEISELRKELELKQEEITALQKLVGSLKMEIHRLTNLSPPS